MNYKRRIFLYFSFFFFHFSFLFSQNTQIDSMYVLVKKQKNDTVKVKTLNELSMQLGIMDIYASADSTARVALSLAQSLGYRSGMAYAYRNIGVAYWYKAEYPAAITYYQKALDMAVQTGDKALAAKVNGNIGMAYELHSDYPNAMEYYGKAIDMFKEIGDKRGEAKYVSSLGVVYRKQGDYPKALKYCLDALATDEQLDARPEEIEVMGSIGVLYDYMGDTAKALEYDLKAMKLAGDLGQKWSMSIVVGNIAIIYDGEKNHLKALEYFFKSLAIVKELHDSTGIGMGLGNIGLEYSQMGKYDSALKYEMLGLQIRRKLGEKEGLAIDLGGIGALYYKEKKFGLAHIYLDSGLYMARQIGDKSLIQENYGNLAMLDSATGGLKDAFADYKLFIEYRDSLSNEENTKKIVKEQMQYEFDKKQAAENAEQDKRDAIAEQERKKQLIIRDAFVVGFLLVLALAFFIFRGYRQKQKANRIITRQKDEVEHQKDLVEEKQKEILDSIHYAQRIQKALLASDALLKENLHEYFVLFKPKDIVSGDFYWATVSNGRFYLAVCDSTGHGVPGAFMSLLNTSFLNEAINEKNITAPNEVFDHARKRLIENISQEGQQDGMDGIVARLTPTNNGGMLQYSAAYNTPLIYRNGEIKELEADKMPVGRSPKEKESFKLYTANLQKGDCLYLFTDGYADQFGGLKGKKFMHKQLQQLIMSNAQLTMAEQKRMLEKTFEDWKGGLEQVDDILVIGIRI